MQTVVTSSHLVEECKIRGFNEEADGGVVLISSCFHCAAWVREKVLTRVKWLRVQGGFSFFNEKSKRVLIRAERKQKGVCAPECLIRQEKLSKLLVHFVHQLIS